MAGGFNHIVQFDWRAMVNGTCSWNAGVLSDIGSGQSSKEGSEDWDAVADQCLFWECGLCVAHALSLQALY